MDEAASPFGRSPELIARAHAHGDRLAIVDRAGRYSYTDLIRRSSAVARELLDGSPDLTEARVAFMIPPGFDYVAVQWGIWLAGGVAVPLCLTHTVPELTHVIEDSKPGIVVAMSEYEAKLRPLAEERGIRFLTVEEFANAPADILPAVGDHRRAMILYTSGTTGQPKGVVTTHGNLEAQIVSLTEAWGWTASDRILLNLPLHHLHGILNVLSCALWSGAVCEMLPGFNLEQVWERVSASELSLFMAVPTIYYRLAEAWEKADSHQRARFTEGCRAMRLMLSGSAALPVPVLERWREISGHTLLERYGMTELGMALSNPLVGDRKPGYVGAPLPGAEVRLIDDNGQEVGEGVAGEVQVRGRSVFLEYWGLPDATRETFTDDGWFITGDVAIRDGGSYRLLGRRSVDIIKSGAEKISAIEIENVVLEHPGVAEVAVVGLPDDEWGQQIVAAVITRDGFEGSAADIQSWCRSRLAGYKVPKAVRFVEILPRNTLGKVVKPDLIESLL